MQLFEFRNTVLGYLNRSARDMTVNGNDLVVSAANQAKREAERLLDFEMLRCQVTLSVDLQDGALLSSAVLQGTSTQVRVNKIERAFITKGGVSRPAMYVTRNTMHKRLGFAWDETISWWEWLNQQLPNLPTEPVVFRSGTRIYCWPGATAGLSEPVTVGLDVTKWSDDYSTSLSVYFNNGLGGGPTYFQTGVMNDEPLFGFVTNGTVAASLQNGAYYDPVLQRWVMYVNGVDSRSAVTAGAEGLYGPYSGAGGNFTAQPQNGTYTGSDFFLTDCDDWLLLATLKRLNFFVKDEKRTLVTQAAVDQAFSSMSAWNNGIGDASADEVTLD